MNICGGCQEIADEDKSEISGFGMSTAEEVIGEAKLKVIDYDTLSDVNLDNLWSSSSGSKLNGLDLFNTTIQNHLAALLIPEQKQLCMSYYQRFTEMIREEISQLKGMKSVRASTLTNKFTHVKFVDNMWYQGQSDDDKPEGFGGMLEKITSNGQAKLRLCCGIFDGKLHTPTGTCFYICNNGEWFFGRMEGGVEKAGVMNRKVGNTANFIRYEGFFISRKLCGPRSKIFYDGYKGFLSYEGQSYEGLPDGKGKLSWNNGKDSFDGEFSLGKANGSGYYASPRNPGKLLFTYWENGIVHKKDLPNPPEIELNLNE